MRVEGWESRLDEYLRGIGPFEWGKSDCCMFSVGAVKATTGVDHGIGFDYTTKAGAAKVLKKAGGVEAIATKALGKHKSPLLAMRGDVVSFESGTGTALGVCVGPKFAAMQEAGLVFFSMTKALKSWSI